MSEKTRERTIGLLVSGIMDDYTAIGLYDEIKRRGMRIGRDIFVLGFDDTMAAA